MTENVTTEPKTESAPAAPAARTSAPTNRGNSSTGSGDTRRPARKPPARKFQRRRKFCKFCADTTMIIDYKDPDLLSQFITDRHKILPSRVTGTCSKHQRHLTTAIKRARILALLAFTTLHHD